MIELSTNQKGNITELEVLTAFSKLGYNVCIPFGGNARYDFIAEKDGNFFRIQTKTASPNEVNDPDYIIFQCRSSHYTKGKHTHTKYTKSEIDYFATVFNSKCYLVPIEECSDEKRLRFKSPKNNQKTNISWAKDYEIEEVLK